MRASTHKFDNAATNGHVPQNIQFAIRRDLLALMLHHQGSDLRRHTFLAGVNLTARLTEGSATFLPS
jgi:hypothetical protein